MADPIDVLTTRPTTDNTRRPPNLPVFAIARSLPALDRLTL